MKKFEVTAEDFEQLCDQVRVLQDRVRVLEERLAELEPSTGGKASGYQVPASPPRVPSGLNSRSSTPAVAAGVDLPEFRVVIAEGIGSWIRGALSGVIRGTSGRENIPQASRYYLVFRDAEGNSFNPPKVFQTWAAAKPLCLSGRELAVDAVFVGLPSKAESRIVVVAAGCEIPAALQRA